MTFLVRKAAEHEDDIRNLNQLSKTVSIINVAVMIKIKSTTFIFLTFINCWGNSTELTCCIF